MLNFGRESPLPGTIINNFYPPDSSIRELFTALENRLSTNSQTLELTRKELELFAKALRELEQKTAALERLPDGRTKFGEFVAGDPIVLLENARMAATNQLMGDYETAYLHATNALALYENSPNGAFVTRRLKPEFVAALYGLASEIAGARNDWTNTLAHALKSQAAYDTVDTRLSISMSFFNLKRTNEALSELTNAIAKFPTDTRPFDLLRFMNLLNSITIRMPSSQK